MVAQLVKNQPAIRESWVRSLGWEDDLEKEVAAHSSILARRATVHGVAESDTTERSASTAHSQKTAGGRS